MTFDEAYFDMVQTGRTWIRGGTKFFHTSRNAVLQVKSKEGWVASDDSYATHAECDWHPVDAPVAEPKPEPPWNAVAAFQAGEKIRYNNWRTESYVQLRGDQIYDRLGKSHETRWMHDLVLHPDEWEPYVEPEPVPLPWEVKRYNHVEAAKLIDDGETVGSGRCGIARWNKEELVWSGFADPNRIATATDFRVVGDET